MKIVPEVMIVRLRVSFRLLFISSMKRHAPEDLLVLPDAVEDDDRVVDGETDERQECGDHVLVDLEVRATPSKIETSPRVTSTSWNSATTAPTP